MSGGEQGLWQDTGPRGVWQSAFHRCLGYAQILQDLGLRRLELIESGGPSAQAILQGFGFEVAGSRPLVPLNS